MWEAAGSGSGSGPDPSWGAAQELAQLLSQAKSKGGRATSTCRTLDTQLLSKGTYRPLDTAEDAPTLPYPRMVLTTPTSEGMQGVLLMGEEGAGAEQADGLDLRRCPTFGYLDDGTSPLAAVAWSGRRLVTAVNAAFEGAVMAAPDLARLQQQGPFLPTFILAG
jgi:hypothetical protein